jgi:solute carrier family 25 carnitine/acylcarnitine transporter 20/29
MLGGKIKCILERIVMTEGVLVRKINNHQISAFYKGVLAPLTNAPFISAFNFASYGGLKRLLEKSNINQNDLSRCKISLFFWSWDLIAGFATGLGCATINTPLDFIKCRLQIEGIHSNQSKGVFELAGNILKSSGFRGVFRGYSLSLVRDIPGTAIVFTSYDIIKKKLKESNKNSGIYNLLAGGLSSFIMWFFIYPQDVIKTRYQLNPQMTIQEIVMDIWNKGGFLEFYKGI